MCHRFRLRKKTWKNPGTVFLDYHVYEEDINISSNWEVFLEVLEGENCTRTVFMLKECSGFRFGQLWCICSFRFMDKIGWLPISKSSLISCCCRTRADEVHIPTGGSDTSLVSLPNETRTLSGGGAGEQQCG